MLGFGVRCSWWALIWSIYTINSKRWALGALFLFRRIHISRREDMAHDEKSPKSRTLSLESHTLSLTVASFDEDSHYKKYVICPRFIKSVEKFCVINSLNIKVIRKTKKLHIYKCVDLISKVHSFKCVIFVVKRVHNLKRGLL